MARFLLGILLFALAACTTTSTPAPPAGPPPAGMAALAITRSSSLLYLAAPADVEVNGEKVAGLAVGESYNGTVRPGPTIITVSAWSAPGRYSFRFNAEAGKSYALLVSPRSEQMTAGLGGGIVGQVVEGNGPFKVTAQ